jgi:hypothetical protein
LKKSGSGNRNGNGFVKELRVIDGEGRNKGKKIKYYKVNVDVKEEYDS